MNITLGKSWGMRIISPLQKLNPSRVDAIALHHMAHPTADIYEVERWHLNQGWRAFGYNYWVDFDGTIYEGRGYQHVGAGVENQNDHIISIGFQGNYQSGLAGIATSPAMPDAQFNAGVDIINWVMERVPTIGRVAGHRDFMATACPGDTFPLAEMASRQKREDNTRKSSVKDCTNELIWRGIITDQHRWDGKGAIDENIAWLFDKYYWYILKNGGSVKRPLSVETAEKAVAILMKQGILSNNTLWINKAYDDPNVWWLLVKLSDYIN